MSPGESHAKVLEKKEQKLSDFDGMFYVVTGSLLCAVGKEEQSVAVVLEGKEQEPRGSTGFLLHIDRFGTVCCRERGAV